MSIRLRLDRPQRYRGVATAAAVVAVGLGIAVLAAPRLTQSDPASGGVGGSHESATRRPETDTARRCTRGLSWLRRWALTRGVEPEPEPREPAWMARLYREH